MSKYSQPALDFQAPSSDKEYIEARLTDGRRFVPGGPATCRPAAPRPPFDGGSVRSGVNPCGARKGLGAAKNLPGTRLRRRAGWRVTVGRSCARASTLLSSQSPGGGFAEADRHAG